MHSQILGWPDLIRFLLASLVLLGTGEFLFRRAGSESRVASAQTLAEGTPLAVPCTR